jgi:predicted nuclease with TOPRIM domain
MEAMRESWTDARMDDLNGKVDALRLETRTEFKAIRGEMKEEFGAVRTEMKEEFSAVRAEMKAGFDRVDERFERIGVRFEWMEERFDQRLDSLNRTLILFSGGACAALITALAGLIATQL